MAAVRTPKNDILVVNNRGKGPVKWITDVHGNLKHLEDYLKKLGPEGQLFIGGDLVDKGPDSIGVLELISSKEYKDRVFAIMGNHEHIAYYACLCLETLARHAFNHAKDKTKWQAELVAIIKRIENAKSSKIAVAMEFLDGNPIDYSNPIHCQWEIEVINLRGHITQNLGKPYWLIELFLNELTQKQIQINSKGELSYQSTSKFAMIKDFLGSLPYIILYTAGSIPLVLVHADMPFSDNELVARINAKKGLEFTEKIYAIWTRGDNQYPFHMTPVRNQDSITALVGHVIIRSDPSASVRKKTNTVNGDLGFYTYNVLMVVDLITLKAELSDETTNTNTLLVLKEINNHLTYVRENQIGVKALQEYKLESKENKEDKVNKETDDTKEITPSASGLGTRKS